MMSDFTGLTAVVTGGSSGIGASVAQELNQRGARVAIMDRAITNPPDWVVPAIADISNDDEVRAAIETIAAAMGGIDILINNAGIGAAGDITTSDDGEWHKVFDVNVVGIARVTRAALPHLRRSKAGAIVNTASVAGISGLRDRALYSATKGAVVALTYAMAADHLADRIRVNAVAPGTADTPWIQRLLASSDAPDELAAKLSARQPIGRLVAADEVAVAIANLASPRAGSTTGTVVTIDGGLTSLRP